jgi:integrase/recombinase XerD
MPNNPNQHFYRSDDQYREQIDRTLTRKKEASEITESDEKIIRAFIAELRAVNGISDTRASKLVSNISGLRRWLPPFDQMVTSDIYHAIDQIQHHGFKQNTMADLIRGMRRIALYLCENNMAAPGLDALKIRKIHPPGYDSATKDISDLLTPDQVMSMISHAGSIKNQAIISTLYEGGMRIGEIGNLQWNQVKFHEEHVSISTTFKTGKARTIPLFNSRGYLAQWKNEYSGNADKPGAFVFVKSDGNPYSYVGLVKMIRKAATNAGIEHTITPHVFRHSRITHLIKEGWKESIIKKMCWGSVETDMFKVYLHLCDEDIENEAAGSLGIKRRGRPTIESKRLEPIQCHKCGVVNPFTHSFCSSCGAPLNKDAIQTAEAATSILSDLLTGEKGEDILRELILLQKKKITSE